MDELQHEINELIVEALMLEGIAPDEIDSDEPMFVEGLGLDSIDALELGVAIRKKYGIRIEAATDKVKEHFRSVRSLVVFIEARQGE